MSHYPTLTVTVTIELTPDSVDQSAEYLLHANAGEPDPHGCTPLFFALQEAGDAIASKLHNFTGTDNVTLRLDPPAPTRAAQLRAARAARATKQNQAACWICGTVQDAARNCPDDNCPGHERAR